MVDLKINFGGGGDHFHKLIKKKPKNFQTYSITIFNYKLSLLFGEEFSLFPPPVCLALIMI